MVATWYYELMVAIKSIDAFKREGNKVLDHERGAQEWNCKVCCSKSQHKCNGLKVLFLCCNYSMIPCTNSIPEQWNGASYLYGSGLVTMRCKRWRSGIHLPFVTLVQTAIGDWLSYLSMKVMKIRWLPILLTKAETCWNPTPRSPVCFLVPQMYMAYYLEDRYKMLE